MRELVKNRMIMLVLLLVTVMAAKAQTEKVFAAFDFLEKNQLDSAKVYIDRAILHAESANDPLTWQVKGFVYKAIYNKNEKGHKQSKSRTEALDAFRKSIILDETKELYSDNVSAMKYLINTMHIHVSELLDPMDYETAIAIFRKEQEYFKIIDPSHETYQAREIEFALALGTVYNSIIESSKDSARSQKYVNLAKSLYTKVLSLEPNNITANYNMGILYYNQAVNLIKNEDYDLDLALLDVVQDQSVKLFKASLPFMEKAYSLDPKREDALEGLSGIYFGLNEPEKSNIYRQRLQDVKKNNKK